MPVSHSNLYTPCLKKSGPLLFYDNSSKSGIIIKISVQQKWTKFQFFFHCKIQKGSAGKVGIKTTISSQICTTLWKASGPRSNKSGPLYSTVNSVQSDENVFITVNVQEECHFFVFLHRLISVTCLKCPPLAHVCFESWMLPTSTDVSIEGLRERTE